MKENWKSIKGYAGLYEVSDMGRVRSLNYKRSGKTKLLNPAANGIGYLHVFFYKDGKPKFHYVHSLVITTFRGPIPPGMQVNHINEDKTDNRLSNLEVVTAKQNCNYGTRNERLAKAMKSNRNRAKQLKLTSANTCAKYTFSSSREASVFFGYKSAEQVGSLISAARQRGENFINIRREKYYFSQEA